MSEFGLLIGGIKSSTSAVVRFIVNATSDASGLRLRTASRSGRFLTKKVPTMRVAKEFMPGNGCYVGAANVALQAVFRVNWLPPPMHVLL
jgi:hypothetical protein